LWENHQRCAKQGGGSGELDENLGFPLPKGKKSGFATFSDSGRITGDTAGRPGDYGGFQRELGVGRGNPGNSRKTVERKAKRRFGGEGGKASGKKKRKNGPKKIHFKKEGRSARNTINKGGRDGATGRKRECGRWTLENKAFSKGNNNRKAAPKKRTKKRKLEFMGLGTHTEGLMVKYMEGGGRRKGMLRGREEKLEKKRVGDRPHREGGIRFVMKKP